MFTVDIRSRTGPDASGGMRGKSVATANANTQPGQSGGGSASSSRTSLQGSDGKVSLGRARVSRDCKPSEVDRPRCNAPRLFSSRGGDSHSLPFFLSGPRAALASASSNFQRRRLRPYCATVTTVVGGAGSSPVTSLGRMVFIQSCAVQPFPSAWRVSSPRSARVYQPAKQGPAWAEGLLLSGGLA